MIEFDYYKKFIKNIIRDIKTKNEDYWSKVKEKEMLKLFHTAAKRVPAYKDFLKKARINPDKIKSIEDFSLIPPINKNNYLNYYPYEMLLWDGDIKKPATIHASSGSTGESTYFRREFKYDLRRAVQVQNFLEYNKLSLKGPTLFIITFGMGVWSAGTGIYIGTYLTSNFNNLSISIISPGVNKAETIKILKKLAPNFKQVIIAGYPPFVKDIIDEAIEAKIDFKKFNLRLIFTGEALPEELREYFFKKTHIKNIFTDVINTYGTSELGTVGIETPLTILISRLAYKKRKLFNELFKDEIRTITFVQYIPYFVNFECIDGELIFTGDNAIPLIRYQPGDRGGILTFSEIKEILSQNNIDINKEFGEANIYDYIAKLPSVYVFERSDLSVTLYGIVIYPEYIRRALFDRELSQFLTGKFTMLTKYDKNKNQYLEINLELRKGFKFKKYYKKKALKKIIESLRAQSSEYRELSNSLKTYTYPKLKFWPYEHQQYFKPGSKQRWVVIEN
jgi:phenylacetate-CoA ligase